jgi:DNA-binding MarR family transcriptional regulator
VVSDSLEDAELARLLSQLLRVVSPAITASAAETLARAESVQVSGLSGATETDGATVAGAAGHDLPAVNGTVTARVTPGAGGAPFTPGPEVAVGLAAISASEARALIELVAARGIAQGQLGGLLGLEKSTVSRLAAGLERKGWVRRGRDEGNQRYIRLYLTPAGRAVAGRVLNAWQSRQERILAALSADERAGLEAGLRGLVRGLAAEGIIGGPAAGDAR